MGSSMKSYYLGSDVSKGYADFIIINENKQAVLQSFQLDDTAVGHQQLCRLLEEFSIQNPCSVIYSAVESTGGYENNWFHTLCNLEISTNIHVARLNPLGTSHKSKASMNRIITDKNAARNIAEYLIDYKKKIIYTKNDQFSSLRR